jgi:ubiquinone/menaquinone biosynthesis C-methylase UbiE
MYDEFRYYRFGLKLGISNLFENHLALGLRKTVGKIAQPVNSFTRFPEYFFMESSMREQLTHGCRVLDVGSPKLFGFYLASHYPAELHLTDISQDDITEYELLWRSVRHSVGKVSFAVQDARRLSYPDNYFDMVYSMSVVEHIEGTDGDREAIREMMRVLKPGGCMVVSVPTGSHYTEQYRIGLQSAAIRTAGCDWQFFQRIYDSRALRQRLTSDSDPGFLVSIFRQHSSLTRRYSAMSENLRGLLGFLTPLVSRAVNRHQVGSIASQPCHYGKVFTSRDVYGDVIFCGQKPIQSV